MSIITATISSDSTSAIIDMPNKNIKYKSFSYKGLINELDSQALLTTGGTSPLVGKSETHAFFMSPATASGSYNGGYVPYTYAKTGDVINESLVSTTISTESRPQGGGQSTNTPNHVLFTGFGAYHDNSNHVHAYHKSTFAGTISMLYTALMYPGVASNTKYAIVAGGMLYKSSGSISTSDYRQQSIGTGFDSLLTKYTLGLSEAKNGARGVSLGQYALFGGGDTTASPYHVNSYYRSSNLIEAFNTSLSRTNTLTLSNFKSSCIGISFNNCAFFIGGVGYSTPGNSGTSVYSRYNSVDVINSSLVKSTPFIIETGDTYYPSAVTDNYIIYCNESRLCTLDKKYTKTISSITVRFNVPIFNSIGKYLLYHQGASYTDKTIFIYETET